MGEYSDAIDWNNLPPLIKDELSPPAFKVKQWLEGPNRNPTTDILCDR